MDTKTISNNLAHLMVATDVLFSSEEIDKIIAQGIKLQADEGIVNTKEESIVKHKTRTCKIGWFYPNEETNWLFDKMIDLIGNINEHYFKFDLNQFEPLQFTSYDSSRKEFYGQHMDCSMGIPHATASRKLSITLQLSDSSDYEGGDLLLYQSREPAIAPKKKGQLVVFPSYVLHEVTPVTSGTRYSLVTWVHGPMFR